MAASSHVQHSQSNHGTESKDSANHRPLAKHEPDVSTVVKGSANNGPLAKHEPDVATVACPGCWRSCLKHLFSQPQEYPIHSKSHVWNLRKVDARSFRIAADRAWYHPPSGHVERLERKNKQDIEGQTWAITLATA